jgi:AICAR transformylase/IMP cyclohydrolase PurH
MIKNFYEVIAAPGFEKDVLNYYKQKKILEY